MLRVLLCLGWLFASWTALAQQPVHFTQAERLVPAAIDTPITPSPQTVAGLPEQGWQQVMLPDVALTRTPGQAKPAATQTVWYRFVIGAAQHTQPAPLYFYLPRWQTVGQVALYGDGRLLWQSEGDLVWNGFNQPVWVSLDPPGQSRPHELLLRMDSVPGLGGGISSAWIGSDEEISWRYHLRRVLQVDLLLAASVAFSVLGLFSLSIWWRRRHESIYMLCFLAALCFVARYIHFVTPLNIHWVPSAWFGWLSVNAVSWLVAVILIFNLRLCGRQVRWLERGIVVSIVLHGVVTLPLLESTEKIAALAPYTYAVVLLFAIPGSLIAFWIAWKTRIWSAIITGAIAVVAFPFGIHDLMMQNYLVSLESVYILPLGQVGFSIMFAIIVHQRYLSGIESLERSHEILAQRLRERESELEKSHARLREIERRELLSKERQRLMRDMHDGVGGSLTGALRMMEQGEYDEDKLQAALRDCVDELRLTIDSLEPVESDITVLLASLRFRLQPRLQAAGIKLLWRVEALPPLPWLTPAHAMHVMRIVQEVVTNIIKHSGAAEIVFSTSANAGQAFIHIDDDGSGFDGGDFQIRNSGRGLGNIAYRVEVLGGGVRWYRREKPAGTGFVLSLPLSAVVNGA